jgi:hypothetical protein
MRNDEAVKSRNSGRRLRWIGDRLAFLHRPIVEIVTSSSQDELRSMLNLKRPISRKAKVAIVAISSALLLLGLIVYEVDQSKREHDAKIEEILEEGRDRNEKINEEFYEDAHKSGLITKSQRDEGIADERDLRKAEKDYKAGRIADGEFHRIQREIGQRLRDNSSFRP